MNLGAALVLLKLARDSGFTVSPITNGPTPPKFFRPRGEITPPTLDIGARPDCGPGKKAIIQFDQWVCVPDFN